MSNNNKSSAILLSVLIAYIMMPIIGQSINVALPAIGKSLSSNPVVLGWISISLFLSIAVFAIPAGRIADIFGRKKIFLLGVTICTVTSFLLAVSYSAAVMIFFRAIQGIGGAMILNTGLVIISSIYPAGQRGKPLGLCMAAIYIGQTLAPFLGGLLTHHLGWRSIFLANVPFGLFIIAFMFWKINDERVEAPGEKVDFVGAIIFGIMIVFIMYGLSIFPSKQGGWLVLAGIVCGSVFIKWEMKVDSPILEMQLFRENRAFLFSILSAFIFFSGVFSVGFLLSLYLQYIKGFTPQSAGFVLASQPIFQAILSPIAGRLVDRVKPHYLSFIGMSSATLGMLLFAFITINTHLFIILIGLFLVGSGWAFFTSTNMNDAIGSVDRKYYGAASGTIATVRQLGMMSSIAMTMFIFSLFIGRVQVTPEYFGLFLKSVKTAFGVLTVLCFTGLLTLVFRGKIKR
jgi:EmrB/QacA subfamily drug resistance transporter